MPKTEKEKLEIQARLEETFNKIDRGEPTELIPMNAKRTWQSPVRPEKRDPYVDRSLETKYRKAPLLKTANDSPEQPAQLPSTNRLESAPRQPSPYVRESERSTNQKDAVARVLETTTLKNKLSANLKESPLMAARGYQDGTRVRTGGPAPRTETILAAKQSELVAELKGYHESHNRPNEPRSKPSNEVSTTPKQQGGPVSQTVEPNSNGRPVPPPKPQHLRSDWVKTVKIPNPPDEMSGQQTLAENSFNGNAVQGTSVKVRQLAKPGPSLDRERSGHPR